MDWLEVSVQVDGEAAEAVSEVLNRYGRGGVVIEHLLIDGLGAHDRTDELRVKAYLPADDVALISRGRSTTYGELRDQVARLRGGFASLGIGDGTNTLKTKLPSTANATNGQIRPHWVG